MKKFLLMIVVAACAVQVKAQDEAERKVQAPVQSVTVFLSGAQVMREWKGNIATGINRLAFDNLSPGIDPQSIQVSAEGNVTILSVQYRVNHLRNQEKSAGIITLEDSLESVNYRIESIQGKRTAYEEEKSMILANKTIGGQNNGVQIAELEDGADFFRKRIGTIMEELINLKREETKLRVIADKLNQQLAEYNNKKNQPSHEAIVTLKGDAAGNCKLQLSYFTYNASWEPFYDIRVKNTQSPVQFFYKARITQRTTEEWNNVKIKLSTGNPAVSGQIPMLNPAYLNLYEPQVYEKRKADYYSATPAAAPEMKSNSINFRGARAEDQVTMTQTATNIEFDIPNPYTISADGNPQTVDIRTLDLKAQYSYSCIPKLDKDAFLMAHIYGNNELFNLTGIANVYYEGTYVGQTGIQPSTSDTLDVSLGRDKRIVIERTQVKDFTARNKMGSNIKETNTWEISIHNTKKEAVDISTDDQVPVSQNKDIEVKVLDQGGATYNQETGKLSWKHSIPAGQTTKIRFSFEVKYPKDKLITPY